MRWAELALLIPALFFPSVRGGADEWPKIEPGLALEFPRDHGAHPEYRTEWWYFTGEAADERGRLFGFQLTFFRSAMSPDPPRPGTSPLRARQVYAAHLAIADVETGRVHFAERLRRGGAGLAWAAPGSLEVTLDDWSVSANDDGRLRLVASDPATGLALDLALAPGKPLVLHGEGGVSPKGPEPGNASAYVSWTRLAAEGRIAVAGSAREVRGEAWYDHEYGSSVLGEGVVGWDWFGLRLDDGRELMLFALRDETGRPRPTSAGTLVERDGTARHLASADFELEVLARWRSPRTGAEYPSRWRVRVPGEGLELELEPRVADAELASGGSTGVVYWEGPVRIRGTAGGSGYAELTGYAGSMAGRF